MRKTSVVRGLVLMAGSRPTTVGHTTAILITSRPVSSGREYKRQQFRQQVSQFAT